MRKDSCMLDLHRVLGPTIAMALLATMTLRAQSGGTITGTVLDQAAKPIPGASITVRNGAAGSLNGTATADNDGRFSIGNLAAGTYTVDTTSPGFALNTRREVPVSSSGSQDLTITLFVDAISQSVTVHETVSLAVDSAP